MSALADAYVWACHGELDALKPGNVHRYASGHGMRVEDVEASAEASAPFVTQQGARIGARILGAVAATRARVGQNTNLGIVLLCAPLAAAAERDESLEQTLAALDVTDAQNAFAAISLAQPAGLGAAPQHDVTAPVTASLRAAMQAAAHRDLIARQYDNAFADVLGPGLSQWRAAREAGANPAQAASDVCLAFLSRWPDTHIARKWGFETAQAVQREAAAILPSLAPHGPARIARLLAWDADLKARGLNPGACADLTVATLFVARLGETTSNGLRLFAKSD